MSVGDLYELTTKQKLYEQDVFNVFHYEMDVDFEHTYANFAEAAIASFEANILPKILAIQSNEIVTHEISCRNLFNASDAATKLVTYTGGRITAAGDRGLPSFNAVGFQMSGDNPAVRKGHKRFAGLKELDQDSGIIAAAGTYTAPLADCEDALAASLPSVPFALSDLFIPVTVKRVREGVAGAYTYRLPSTSGEKVVSRILVAAFDMLVSSQLSRKVGVGI